MTTTYDSSLSAIRALLSDSGIDPFASPQEARRVVERVIDSENTILSAEERQEHVLQLLSEVVGLGPLQQFLDDPEVEEIWINDPSRVFVARQGVPELTTIILNDQQVRDLVERMLHHSGRRLDLSQPFVDAMLRTGERLHVVIPPVAGQHWSVNIRKHIQKARTLDDLVIADMLPDHITQAGKTTLLRALAGSIPRTRRVITCEEVFELSLTNRDMVSLQTRPGNLEGNGAVNLRDLVRESLRMRPETLIVGEVRGAEALDLLLALNAGVPGMATVHANSAREALDKLALLPLLAGENVTSEFVVPTVAHSIDLVCHVHRDRMGRRYLSEILALSGRVEGDAIEVSELWKWNGYELQRGNGTPDFYNRFAQAGFDLTQLMGERQQ